MRRGGRVARGWSDRYRVSLRNLIRCGVTSSMTGTTASGGCPRVRAGNAVPARRALRATPHAGRHTPHHDKGPPALRRGGRVAHGWSDRYRVSLRNLIRCGVTSSMTGTTASGGCPRVRAGNAVPARRALRATPHAGRHTPHHDKGPPALRRGGRVAHGWSDRYRVSLRNLIRCGVSASLPRRALRSASYSE